MYCDRIPDPNFEQFTNSTEQKKGAEAPSRPYSGTDYCSLKDSIIFVMSASYLSFELSKVQVMIM